MKKIIYGLLATVTGLVLLFSYRTSLNPVASATSPVIRDATASAPAPSSGTQSSVPSASSTKTASGWKQGVFAGAASDTPYGPLQVQITVAGGKITAVEVPRYPNGSGRDQEINSYALPQLVRETVSAQSANIDMVSGATYTSQGYQQSLQSALDQART